MSFESRVFLVILFLALLSWVAGLVFYILARSHYIGSKGAAAFIFPIGRMFPSNYAPAGAPLLRGLFYCMAIFACLIATSFAIAYFRFSGNPQ